MVEPATHIIGILDATIIPGADLQRAWNSLAWCNRRVRLGMEGSMEELSSVLASAGANDWVFMIRSNEWLPDDANCIAEKLARIDPGVSHVEMSMRWYIGDAVVDHPLLMADTSSRLIRASKLRISENPSPFDLCASSGSSGVLDGGCRIHCRIAVDLPELIERVLPTLRRSAAHAGPHETISRFYRHLEASYAPGPNPGLQTRLGLVLAWSELQKEIGAGTFDNEPHLLDALRLIPSFVPSTEERANSVDQARVESLLLALNHAELHLESNEQKIKDLDAELVRVQDQLHIFNSIPVLRRILQIYWRKRTRHHV